MRGTKSRGMRSSTCASVDAALYATTRIPIRFMRAKGTERSRPGRRPALPDAAVVLLGDGGDVLVDVVDACLARVLGRVLDARRDAAPLDRLYLVVDRAVRAVHGEVVAHERAPALLPQRQVGLLTLVPAVVDETAAGAAPERQDDLLVVLVDVDGSHVAHHRPGDDLRPHRRRQRAPVGAGVAAGAHELLARLAQRPLDRLLSELLADEGEERRDPIDGVVLQRAPLVDSLLEQCRAVVGPPRNERVARLLPQRRAHALDVGL